MIRRSPSPRLGALVLLVAALSVLIASAVAVGQSGTGGGAGEIGVSTGVFTDDQAEAGGMLFAQRCAGCHGGDLSGGFGPRLAPLASYWQGRSLAELFAFVQGNMPFDAPGSLSPEHYAQVIAFVLHSNGYGAGEEDLAAEASALEAFVIDSPNEQ